MTTEKTTNKKGKKLMKQGKITAIFIFIFALMICFYFAGNFKIVKKTYFYHIVSDASRSDLIESNLRKSKKELDELSCELQLCNSALEDEIDKETRQCVEKTGGVTSQMNKCADDEITKRLALIDKHLAQLKEILTYEQYKQVLESQKIWEDYKENEFQILQNIISQRRGNIYTTYALLKVLSIVQDRAEYLEGFVNMMSE